MEQIELVDVMRGLFITYNHYLVINQANPGDSELYSIGCECARNDNSFRFEWLALIDGDRVRDSRRFVLAADPDFFSKVLDYLLTRHDEEIELRASQSY